MEGTYAAEELGIETVRNLFTSAMRSLSNSSLYSLSDCLRIPISNDLVDYVRMLTVAVDGKGIRNTETNPSGLDSSFSNRRKRRST